MQRVMKVMDGFPKMLTDVIAATDPDAVAEHGMWTRHVTGVQPESLLCVYIHTSRWCLLDGFATVHAAVLTFCGIHPFPILLGSSRLHSRNDETILGNPRQSST